MTNQDKVLQAIEESDRRDLKPPFVLNEVAIRLNELSKTKDALKIAYEALKECDSYLEQSGEWRELSNPAGKAIKTIQEIFK